MSPLQWDLTVSAEEGISTRDRDSRAGEGGDVCGFPRPHHSRGQSRTHFLGAWSLETASQEGKSGRQQTRRSSSRALAVSASACSLYSSSVRNFTTGGSLMNHGLILLKHTTSGCHSPVQSNPYVVKTHILDINNITSELLVQHPMCPTAL